MLPVLLTVKNEKQDHIRTENFSSSIKSDLCIRSNKLSNKLDTMICNGTKTENRQEWLTEAVNFYAGIYSDSSIVNGVVDAAERDRLVQNQAGKLQHILSTHEQHGKHIEVPLWLMMQSRALFTRKAGSSPGLDGITWDVLGLLDTGIIEKLRVLFEHRVNGAVGHRGPIKQWRKVLVKLIPKTEDASHIKNWRPISLTACLQKWYRSIVSSLVNIHSDALSPDGVGFREGGQVRDITETIRTCLEKSRAWGLGCSILQADISKAFDSMTHSQIGQSLDDSNTPHILQHAILQELSCNDMLLNLDGMTSEVSVFLESAGKQGATETPALWNRHLEVPMKAAKTRFALEGLGFVLPVSDGADIVTTHMFWADDCYFFGQNIDQTRRMFSIASEEIAKVGLSWKANSLKVLDNARQDGETIVHDWGNDSGSWKIHDVPSFVALGVGIDRIGSTECAVSHRLKTVHAIWNKVRTKFCCRRTPLLLRTRRFYDTIGRSLLFGAGGWQLKENIIAQLCHCEQTFLREMTQRNKWEDESWPDFYTRVDYFVKSSMSKAHVVPVVLQAFQLYFGWAGHVARMCSSKLIKRVYDWRNLGWFRMCQHTGADSNGEHQLRLAHRGRPSRWEDDVEKCLGCFWQSHAGDRCAWRSLRFEAASRRWLELGARGGRGNEHGSPVMHISPKTKTLLGGVVCPPGISIMACVDNLQVSSQVNGIWPRGSDKLHNASVDAIRWMLHCLRDTCGLSTWPRFSPFLSS